MPCLGCAVRRVCRALSVLNREHLVRFSHVSDPRTWGPPPTYGYRTTAYIGPFKTDEEARQAWALLIMPAMGTA